MLYIVSIQNLKKNAKNPVASGLATLFLFIQLSNSRGGINGKRNSSGQYSESTGWNVTVNATARYNAGYDSAHLSGVWSGNTLTVTKVQSGSANSATCKVTAGITYNSSTHKYTATAYGNSTARQTSTSGTEAYDAGVSNGYAAGDAAGYTRGVSAGYSSGYSAGSPKSSVTIGSRVTGTTFNCTITRSDNTTVAGTINVGSTEYNRGWNACLDACTAKQLIWTTYWTQPNSASARTCWWYSTYSNSESVLYLLPARK